MAGNRSELVVFFSDAIKTWGKQHFRGTWPEGGNNEKNRHRLQTHLQKAVSGLGENRNLLNCEYCTQRWEFIVEFDKYKGKKRAIRKKRQRRGVKVTHTWDIVCGCENNAIYVTKKELEDIISSRNESSVPPQSVRNKVIKHPKERLARKCYGIHPHCSICGECHTNVRTHHKGHPRR